MASDFFFNPFDDATRRNPYPHYSRVRELRAFRHPGLPVTSIFNYEDVIEVLRDWRTWSSRFPPPEIPRLQDQVPSMIGLDPPEHDRLRALVNQAFTPKIIRRLEPRMVEIAHQLLDRALTQKSVDLVQALTYPLPVTVIAEIIGVPAEDSERFKDWSDKLVEDLGAGLLAPADLETFERNQKLVDELRAYFAMLVEVRRREPREDLLSGLVAAELEGSKLSFEELVQMLILLLVAGNETTTTLIGNGVLTLLEQRDALARVREDPSLVPAVVEEVLRFSSPVQLDPRCATADVELAGTKVNKGEIAMCWLGSANRDPAVFQDPERFDVDRKESRHLAFGFGTHYCLGSNLARLEAQIALRVLLERTRGFELASSEPLPLHKSFVFRGFRSIPMQLEPK